MHTTVLPKKKTLFLAFFFFSLSCILCAITGNTERGSLLAPPSTFVGLKGGKEGGVIIEREERKEEEEREGGTIS